MSKSANDGSSGTPRAAANDRWHRHDQFAAGCAEAGQIICDVGADTICRSTRLSGKYRAGTDGAGKDGFYIAVGVGHMPILVEGMRFGIDEAHVR